MTVHLENELVGSAYDAVKRVHSYTVERDGKRWTVQVPDSEFERLAAPARRLHLGRKLEAAMRGREDV